MLLTGYGRRDFGLLYKAEPEDWLYDGILAYDILASFAEEVSIVGHSTGGTIAVYIAQHRPVKHLILSGPNLFPAPSDRRYRAISQVPIVSDLIRWFLPVFEKPIRPGRVTNTDTLDPEAALKDFHYKTLPMQSLVAQWELQDMVDITEAKYQSLTLAYGEQDISVDVAALMAFLKKKHIPFQAFSFANSAHNILRDYEKHAAVDTIFNVLKQ